MSTGAADVQCTYFLQGFRQHGGGEESGFPKKVKKRKLKIFLILTFKG